MVRKRVSLGQKDGSRVRKCDDQGPDGIGGWGGKGCSEMSEPRFLAHAHQDARTEGWYMLLNVDHNS